MKKRLMQMAAICVAMVLMLTEALTFSSVQYEDGKKNTKVSVSDEEPIENKKWSRIKMVIDLSGVIFLMGRKISLS